MGRTLKQIIEDIHPLTRSTLRNVVRMSLNPTGILDFAEAVAENLRVTNRDARSLFRYSGILCDATKYLVYGYIIGKEIYKN